MKNMNHWIWALTLRSTKEFIGGIGLNLEITHNRGDLGYWVAVPFWNNGYMTEAVEAILKFGFENLDLNKITASHLIENPSSGKVMMNNKMIKEGELINHFKKGDIYRSVYQYRLTKSEYKVLRT